ncbi:MAG: hypothetical protein AAB477_03015 [Patescibacteria group bacterium]
MDKFKDLFPSNLYHSYVVEGNPSSAPGELREFFEHRGDIEIQSPDTFFQICDSFTMDDSSKLKEWHSLLGTSGGKRMCIIGAKFINHDAERTLLKIIEEPAEGTHFFIIVPNSQILQDTILSRVHIVKTTPSENNLLKISTTEFIKSTLKERIDSIAKIIDEHKDEEGSGGIRYRAIEFVNSLEKTVYEKWKSDKQNNNLQFSLEELARARDFLSTPGASAKMILEHIALVL